MEFPSEFEEKSMKIETITWSEISSGGKAIAEQILALEERNKSKESPSQESE